MRTSRLVHFDSPMETTSKESKRSRVDLRYRHRAQDVSVKKEPEQKNEKKWESRDETDEPLLKREQKGRAVMGQAHRMFHRRAAVVPSKVLTVVVDVVATVDTNGSIIGLATSTPGLPTSILGVVAVQAVPTVVLPSVPAVPPFPSDLTVPAYPFPSGVPIAGASSSSPLTSLLPTSTSVSESVSVQTSDIGYGSSITPSVLPSSDGLNSTLSSKSCENINTLVSRLTFSGSLLSATLASTLNSTSSVVSTSSVSSSSRSFSSSQTSAYISITSSSDPSASTSAGGGGDGPANTNVAPVPAATTAVGDVGAQSTQGPTPALATTKVVGSVIGSLAGAALFLVIILLLLQRHKRKQRGVTRQITADDAADSQPIAASAQQMAQGRSHVPASTAAFFKRFSGASRSTVETTTTGGGERGFQRISGRKLPSAFSEGMTSDQFVRENTLSGSTFYQDDKGFYGGPGIEVKEPGESSALGAVIPDANERVIAMPSPARTPTIHHQPPPFGQSRNGGSMLSPPHSPNPSITPLGTLGRSHPSQDGSRNSKFTEDV